MPRNSAEMPAIERDRVWLSLQDTKGQEIDLQRFSEWVDKVHADTGDEMGARKFVLTQMLEGN